MLVLDGVSVERVVFPVSVLVERVGYICDEFKFLERVYLCTVMLMI